MSIDLADHAGTEQALLRWISDRSCRRLGVVLAAGELGPAGPLPESDLSAWAHTFAVNVLGNLAVLRGLLGRMLEDAFGRIVFFGGGGAGYAYPVFPAYACSKAALVRAVENIHEDLKERGDFSVVCLAPGAVETDLLRKVRAAGAEVRTTAPPDDAVRFVEAFLTRDSRALSGRFIHVRDSWPEFLVPNAQLPDSRWKLRRAE
jgi:NAD(P)-dependent dehydrogenase (short-subunit alcohol dehydrogenase family)